MFSVSCVWPSYSVSVAPAPVPAPAPAPSKSVAPAPSSSGLPAGEVAEGVALGALPWVVAPVVALGALRPLLAKVRCVVLCPVASRATVVEYTLRYIVFGGSCTTIPKCGVGP